MRLVCPNCDAQYEVADEAIPADGRDVQCSACGTMWFHQPSGPLELVARAEPPVYAPPEALSEVPTEAPAEPSPPEVQPSRRTLDEKLLAVLREEAEREAAARRAETARGIETQPDLGLDAVPPLPRQTRPRDVFPDIEEINSTLRPAVAHDGLQPMPEAAPDPRDGAAFRQGFLLMVALGGLVLATYLLAPQLVRQVPQAAPALDAFTAVVDQLRLTLDGWMQQATAALKAQ